MRGQLHQRAHFAVGSQPLWALDETNRGHRKFLPQLLHSRYGGIVERPNAKKQFKLPGITLPAMAAEGVDHARIEPLERFENADAGRELRLNAWAAAAEKKSARSNNHRQIVAHPCNGQRRRRYLYSLGQCVRHHKGSLQFSVLSCQLNAPVTDN